MKSGIFIEELLFFIYCSDRGTIQLILTASYTSIAGLLLFFMASTNARIIKKSIPPWPAWLNVDFTFENRFHSG